MRCLEVERGGPRQAGQGRIGSSHQARMAKDIHELLKVSPGPAMPDPFTPCGRATHSAVGLLLLSADSDTPRHTSLVATGRERED
jgi:hypothetical protein